MDTLERSKQDYNLKNIPKEMQNLHQWVLWKLEKDKKGRPTKIPYRPDGYMASSTNPRTWVSFHQAISTYRSGDFSGIGFVFTANDPLVGIDFDNCFDEEGQLTKKIDEIVESLGSYCEISQSGQGIHVIVKGQAIETVKTAEIEIYSKERYFAMTGDILDNDLTTIEERYEQVQYLHDIYSTKKEPAKKEFGADQPQTLSDDQILKKARNAKNAAKFVALYDKGDTTNYGSESEADLALANILAFWTKNGDQIERLMRDSALYREKFDKHPDYLRGRTIENALATVTDGYKANNGFSSSVKDTSQFDLQKELKNRYFLELAKMEREWEEKGRKGRKPTTISPIRCAEILPEYISFILFDLEENTRVAMYLPKDGIYTRNTTLIKRVISWLEPKLNNRKADEVIYHLTNMAEVKSKTESRYLIPVENGVFNLKTKTLEPFSPNHVFTTKISTPYIVNPPNPVIDGWNVESWLNSIACGDQEIVTLLWQVINDSLNGNYSRKKAIFLVGEGNNSKGTFQELISNLLGAENIATLKVNEFDERFKLSLLEGKTAVIGDDVPTHVYIDDSSNFNSVTTGDVVQVEFKNKQPYSTAFKCSVIQSTNAMPRFKNKSNGTIRRIVIVPFNANFDGEKENFNIKDEYIKDKKVLQYVLHKAINMDFQKFDIPQASMQELEVFKQDNDPVLDFKVSVFDDWNIQKVPKYIVYGFYKKFCVDNGYKYLSDRQFHKQFKQYLDDGWNPDAQYRYYYENLMDKFGDLDILGIGFPDQSKNQKSYENTKLKAM